MSSVEEPCSLAEEGRQRRGHRFARATLMLLVFSSGAAVMGLEMTASRLIAPYFGSTLSVWTSLIGLILIFLTGGYFVGGILADRYSSPVLLGLLVVTAGALVTVVPAVSVPVLRAAWDLTPRAGLLVSSLAGTFALFSFPMVLLGCVCPFAMKLSVEDLGHTGRTSARIYAVSALGSVVGTFLPALVMIDRWGVRRSIILFGVLLIAAGLLLLSRLRFLPAAAPALLLFVPLPPLLSAEGTIAQEESQYNYLQVVDAGDSRVLVADWGVFSIYTPGRFRTHQYFDYMLLAPLLREQPPRTWLRNVLIVGLGSGTMSKQLSEAYGPLPVDGVEIDRAIVELGRRYFDMSEPNLSVHVTDGRVFLGTHARRYDWVLVDAYQGSEIPFHLVTQEFFEALREHMTPEAVLSVNIAWWQPDDQELLRRVAASVRRQFGSIYAVTGISSRSGAVLLAGSGHMAAGNALVNAETLGHGGLIEIAREVVGDGEGDVRLSAMEGLGRPLTDDRAPVAEIADRMYRRTREQQYRRERDALAP